MTCILLHLGLKLLWMVFLFSLLLILSACIESSFSIHLCLKFKRCFYGLMSISSKKKKKKTWIKKISLHSYSTSTTTHQRTHPSLFLLIRFSTEQSLITTTRQQFGVFHTLNPFFFSLLFSFVRYLPNFFLFFFKRGDHKKAQRFLFFFFFFDLGG